MANYVCNKITFADEYWYNEFVKDGQFDIANGIPMPETIEECPDEYIRKNYEMTSSDYVPNKPWFDHDKFVEEKWGGRYSFDSFCDDDSLTVYYQTKWEPSINFFDILHSMGVAFSAAFAEEQFAYWCGIYEDGSITRFPDGSDDAANIWFDLWGDEESYFKDSKGNWRYIEEIGSYFDEDKGEYFFVDFNDKKEVEAYADNYQVATDIINSYYCKGYTYDSIAGRIDKAFGNKEWIKMFLEENE